MADYMLNANKGHVVEAARSTNEAQNPEADTNPKNNTMTVGVAGEIDVSVSAGWAKGGSSSSRANRPMHGASAGLVWRNPVFAIPSNTSSFHPNFL
jgi:hypothetical protein